MKNSSSSYSREYIYFLIDDFVKKSSNIYISLDQNGFGRDPGHRKRGTRESSYDETNVWLRVSINLFDAKIKKPHEIMKFRGENSDCLSVTSRSR